MKMRLKLYVEVEVQFIQSQNETLFLEKTFFFEMLGSLLERGRNS